MRKRRRKAEIAADKAADEIIAHHLAGTIPLPTTRRKRPPRSSTERSRNFRAKGREIGRIPIPRHRRVREKCSHDLLSFGLLYCMDRYEGMKPLLKRPPSPRMIRFVRQLQEKILRGGLKHVRWPRGKGKSTWVKIALIWAALYGHKFFMVVVEKVKGMAQIVVEEVWKRIQLSPLFHVDFPEFSIPMRDVALSPQHARADVQRQDDIHAA